MRAICSSITSRWDILYKSNGRKLILFGTGKMATEFLSFHRGTLPIEAVIDNDIKKHFQKLGDVIENIYDSRIKELPIEPVDILNRYDNDEVFIFIANVQPKSMIRQLESFGKEHMITFAEWKDNQERMPFYQKIKNNKVVFFMYMHGAHEKAITNKLLQYRSGLDIVWVVSKKRKDVPLGVREITTDYMFDCKYEAASARVWVTGLELLDNYFQKRDGQQYVQVKHWSSLTMKVFGPKCSEKVVSAEEYKHIVNAYEENNKKMDVVLTGSKFDEESCRKGWGYSGPFIRVGSSRSDIMFDNGTKKSVYESIGLKDNVHLAMYAPTFRWPFTDKQPFCSFDFERIHKTLEQRFGGEWRILLRLHPLVADQVSKLDIPSFVIDVSEYDDSEELALVADLTITDYSSIMFEPAYAYKPVFLYAPDKDEYNNKHPLLLEYDNLPFPSCVTTEELTRAILKFDRNIYETNLKRFFEHHDVHEDGHASERVAMYILGVLDAKRGVMDA